VGRRELDAGAARASGGAPAHDTPSARLPD
jgi:hypothetical protein